MKRADVAAWLAASVGALGAGSAPAGAPSLTAADYTAAAALLEGNLRGTVKNQSVEPHWIGDRGAFWYRRDEAIGTSYVRFDPETATKRPLFDHQAVATLLNQTLGPAFGATATDLRLTRVVIGGNGTELTAVVGKQVVRCDLAALTCAVSAAPVPEPQLLPSPDRRWAAFVRDHNVVVRETATGKETQLTTDGAPDHGYGTVVGPAIIVQRTRLVLPPIGAAWSPDSRFLIVPENDERGVATVPFVEWVPENGSRRPIVYPVRSAYPGDRDRIRTVPVGFEVATGRRIPLQVPERYRDGVSVAPIGWDVGRGRAFFLASGAGLRSGALLRVDLGTGATHVVAEDSSDTRVEFNAVQTNGPNVMLLAGGSEAIWYSARSGWGHLYRYDVETGRLENPITTGEWAVADLLTVDERRREVYFTAGGREPGHDPYHRHLYKASLDGGAPVLLTDIDADHEFDPPRSAVLPAMRGRQPAAQIRPDAGIFLDSYSTVSTPPITVVRSTVDGHLIAEVERADASALYAAGWQPPIRERVKAADGATDLYVLYQPPLRTIGRAKHPVIDAAYGGPQTFVASRNFIDAYFAANPVVGRRSLARLGFAVVTVDGRGTPGRSRAFRDVGYPEFTRIGVEDHVAALRQLAARHPEMDLDRVGVYGWSWGGAFAARAILSRPDVYRVAAATAGLYDYAAAYDAFSSFIGVPEYADHSSYRTRADEVPANWKSLDIPALAPNLQGRLMIVYGDQDENVPANQALRLVDALTKANKRYDLVYMAGKNHGVALDGYAIKRTWDHFVEHLLGAAPVPDVAVVMKPPYLIAP